MNGDEIDTADLIARTAAGARNFPGGIDWQLHQLASALDAARAEVARLAAVRTDNERIRAERATAWQRAEAAERQVAAVRAACATSFANVKGGIGPCVYVADVLAALDGTQ